MVSSTYPEHHLVGVCNESRSPSAYWPATAIRYCADQTPEVVWPRGPGRQVSRSFPCSTSLHIACPKKLEAASRSLNGCSNCQKLPQHQNKLVFSYLLQNRMPALNVLLTTGLAELYFTLNPLTARPTAHWCPAALP